MKSTNILYLSYDGMTDPLGRSQVLPYLIGLTKHNLNFHIISFEKKENYNLLKDEIALLCKEHKINWHPQFYTKRPLVLSTLYDINHMYRVAKRLHKIHDFKVVHSRSYISSLVSLKLKKKNGIKFIFDIRGFWVDERVEGNIWNIKNPLFLFIYKYFKKKEKLLFSNCDYCISLTNAAKTELLTWNLKKELKIKVIPCCVDLNLFDFQITTNESKKEILNKLNFSENDFVFCYLGSLSTVYLFDKVLKTVSLLHSKNENVKFLIITKEDPKIVDGYMQLVDLKNTDFIKTISLDRLEIPAYLSVCNYSIYYYKPSFSRKATSPTRLAELLSCGLKIISNDKVGDSREIFTQNEIGYLIDDFEDGTLALFSENFQFDKAYDKMKIREIAKENFELEKGIELYHQVYKELL